MKLEKGRRIPAIPEINVTPLIDVLLVLLIIFMVLGPAHHRKFEARVQEKAKPNETPNPPDFPLVVTINRAGGYLLNQQAAATLEILGDRLRRALDGRPSESKAVFVKAPRQSDYGEVVRVIDVMKTAGSAPIGLQIEGLEQ
ncbi:MAG TPA: biopolymer transporter ExbD [Blastocatellia bacterium]|nr:biopolymer transporter ExbD [Blastocatellia bacterium]